MRTGVGREREDEGKERKGNKKRERRKSEMKGMKGLGVITEGEARGRFFKMRKIKDKIKTE